MREVVTFLRTTRTSYITVFGWLVVIIRYLLVLLRVAALHRGRVLPAMEKKEKKISLLSKV
jgi:hypothetical protein